MRSQGRPDGVAADVTLPRRRLILVCGAGGTGKTTLADLLSRALNVACLHKDDIKTALHDVGIVTSNSFQVFLALAERQLSNGVDLIIEATMHEPADWGVLRRWQDDFGLELICVICAVDQEERLRRIRERERHPAHADADRRQLTEPEPALDYARLPGRHIEVWTGESAPETARGVLTQLRTV